MSLWSTALIQLQMADAGAVNDQVQEVRESSSGLNHSEEL